jgi:hypothetical protein
VIFRGIVARDARRVGLLLTMCVFGAGRVSAQAPPPAPVNQAPPPAAVNQAPPAPSQAPAPANQVQVANGTLNILVLLGENTVNNVRVPMPSDLVVEVRDQDDRPVEGATVTFQLPLMGASGSFDGGVRNQEMRTNVQGQAATKFTPNKETGRMTIQVKAVAGGLSGMTTITERNSTTSVAGVSGGPGAQGRRGGWIRQHKLLLIISAAAVGGAIVAVLITRGGSSSSSTAAGTTAITITPGVPTIGGAH